VRRHQAEDHARPAGKSGNLSSPLELHGGQFDSTFDWNDATELNGYTKKLDANDTTKLYLVPPCHYAQESAELRERSAVQTGAGAGRMIASVWAGPTASVADATRFADRSIQRLRILHFDDNGDTNRGLDVMHQLMRGGLLQPDARSKAVRRRVAKQVAGLDRSRESEAMRWTESVSEFDAQ
jgi:hypothetical protein